MAKLLFVLDNLTASVTRAVDLENTAPPERPSFPSKLAFQQWCTNATTRHWFVSGVEGQVPTLRVSVSNGNPPTRWHALIADYDGAPGDGSEEAIREAFVEKAPVQLLPTFIARTFSGGLRVLWFLASSLMVPSAELLKEILKQATKRMKLSRWCPGFDSASVNLYQYFELSGPLMTIGGVIPEETAHFWAYEASRHVPSLFSGAQKIDLAVVAEEVHKRFPGRWIGEFKLGARGCRFWDPMADNHTAAVVLEGGCLCFTGPKPFVSWAEIFGADWVRQHEEDRIAKIRKIAVCDEDENYWILGPQGWLKRSRSAFAQDLRCFGFSSRIEKGQTASEIDFVQVDIRNNCSVTKALPFVHMPPGVLEFNGRRFLNIATAKCLPPADLEPPIVPERHFPNLWSFLSTFFDPPEQLDYFLGWLKHFYANGLAQTPKAGQAVIIAGPPGRGKNFLSNGLVSYLVGGHADASAFLAEGSQWSDEELMVPLLTVDDQLASSDPRNHMRFSALIKKLVANRNLLYNGKWRQRGLVIWLGRIIITCNMDPESLRIIPDLEMSILDKISLFKAGAKAVSLPGFEAQQRWLVEEGPKFARWLLEWTPPAHIVDPDPRFGVRSYHCKELATVAMQASSASLVLELLTDFLDDYAKANPSATAWMGSTAQLYACLASKNEAIRQWTLRQLGTAIGVLISRGYKIQRCTKRGATIWEIPLDLGDQFDDKAGQTG